MPHYQRKSWEPTLPLWPFAEFPQIWRFEIAFCIISPRFLFLRKTVSGRRWQRSRKERRRKSASRSSSWFSAKSNSHRRKVPHRKTALTLFRLMLFSIVLNVFAAICLATSTSRHLPAFTAKYRKKLRGNSWINLLSAQLLLCKLLVLTSTKKSTNEWNSLLNGLFSSKPIYIKQSISLRVVTQSSLNVPIVPNIPGKVNEMQLCLIMLLSTTGPGGVDSFSWRITWGV